MKLYSPIHCISFIFYQNFFFLSYMHTLQKLLTVFKKEDSNNEQNDRSTTTTTTTTTTTSLSSTPPASPTLNGQPTANATKIKPLIRIDSFGPDKIPAEEPAHVRKLRENVKQDVNDLIKARKLHALESITSFYMKDTKHGKYSKAYIRLAKNHQVLSLYYAMNQSKLFRQSFVGSFAFVRNRS